MPKKIMHFHPVLVCCGMMFCTSTPKKYTSYELQIICLICVDCDIGSKEKTKIRNADSNSHNLDPESSIPLLQENKYKVKQWEVIILWSVYIFRL